jgi:hypothetical protein
LRSCCDGRVVRVVRGGRGELTSLGSCGVGGGLKKYYDPVLVGVLMVVVVVLGDCEQYRDLGVVVSSAEAIEEEIY